MTIDIPSKKSGRCRDCRHCLKYDHRHKTWVKCATETHPDLRIHYEVACPFFEPK